MDFITNHQTEIRMGTFIGLLVLMGGLEFIIPRKQRTQKRLRRWGTNIAIIVIDSVLLRAVVGLISAGLAVGVAAFASAQGWGLFNLIHAPQWLEFILALIIFDMMIYWQHVASHYIPALWALHQVHHADRDIDATTGIRFHPVEIILSMLYKMLLVLIIGPSVAAMFIFEVILNGCAVFNHANIKLPKGLDRIIRLFLVTPDMHRVHHSVVKHETNANYGFSISLWDRLFGSYIDQPQAGHDDMIIGLPQFQNNDPSTLGWAMLVPFRKHKIDTPNSEKVSADGQVRPGNLNL